MGRTKIAAFRRKSYETLRGVARKTTTFQHKINGMGVVQGELRKLRIANLPDLLSNFGAPVHPGIGLCAHMGSARGAATACRQGAARRLACRGRTARFPRCCRAAGRHRGHHAPSLHRCGYRPRRPPCGHPRSRVRRIVPEVKIGTTAVPSEGGFFLWAPLKIA